MSALLAEYDSVEAAVAAADALDDAGFRLADALTPFPVPDLSRRLGASAGPLRPVMAVAGLATAALAYGLEYWTAVHAYPLDSGGRPLNSWPVFLLVPFEVGVLAAALAGFVTFLWRCGLPRLHHPLFAVPGTERATQDRFFLLVEAPGADAERIRLRLTLARSDPMSLGEVGP